MPKSHRSLGLLLRGRAYDIKTKNMTPKEVKPFIAMGATHGKRDSSEPCDPEGGRTLSPQLSALSDLITDLSVPNT